MERVARRWKGSLGRKELLRKSCGCSDQGGTSGVIK
jgi:hypothetical protein